MVGASAIEGCAAPCPLITVALPGLQPGDVLFASLGVDGTTSVVDGGSMWTLLELRRSGPSQFSGWLFTRTVGAVEPGQYSFPLTGVGPLGAAVTVSGHRGVVLEARSSLIGAQSDPPESPAINVVAGGRLVDFFVTDTANPDAGWVAPAGTCGRKLRGRVALVDQPTPITALIPARTTAQPIADGPTAGFAIVLRELDAGAPDAGAPDAGTPDAGAPDAGAPDGGLPPQGPRTLAVGCDCTSGGGGPELILMLLCLGIRRARVLVLLIASAAWGQAISDDFETGTLSGWTQRACASQTLTVSPAAAHRGQAGLRLTDTSTTEPCVQGVAISKDLPSSATDLYTRVWLRQTKPNTGGDSLTLDVSWDGPGGGAHGYQIDFQGRLRVIAQPALRDGGVDYLAADTNFTLRDAGWVLVEGCTLRRGGASTTAIYALNGVEAQRQSFDGFSTGFDQLTLGEVFSGSPFTGEVDFDDVRADTRPMASRLAIRPAAPLRAGACTPIAIALEASLPASDGGVGPPPLAPYPVQLATEGASFFRDDACSVAESAPVIAQGANQLTLHIRPASPDQLTLRASHPDFLSATLVADVSAASTDGGTGSTPRSLYALGCRVGGGSGLALLVLLFALSRLSARTS